MKRRTLNIGLSIALASSLMACSGNIKKQDTGEMIPADTMTTVMEGIQTKHVGHVKVTWLKDNAEKRLMPLELFGNAPQTLVDSLHLQAGVPSSVSAFLVETEGLRILFDTGMGASDSQLLPGLKSLGLSPTDINYLYLTHFHGDHIGGMMKGDSAVFPNAQIYASKAEFDAWMTMPESKNAQVVRTINAYKDRLHLMAFGDTLTGGVIAMEATGHTPGHTIYQIGKLLIAGDLMHGAALQLADPTLCASYDMDSKTAIKKRQQYLQYARDNNLTMAGMHFPEPAFLSLN